MLWVPLVSQCVVLFCREWCLQVNLIWNNFLYHQFISRMLRIRKLHSISFWGTFMFFSVANHAQTENRWDHNWTIIVTWKINANPLFQWIEELWPLWPVLVQSSPSTYYVLMGKTEQQRNTHYRRCNCGCIWQQAQRLQFRHSIHTSSVHCQLYYISSLSIGLCSCYQLNRMHAGTVAFEKLFYK